MQKTYTESFLTKKQIKNRGEVQQYYVKDHRRANCVEKSVCKTS